MTEEGKLKFAELLANGKCNIGQFVLENNGTISNTVNIGNSNGHQEKRKVKVEILKQCAEKVKHLFWEPCAITVVYCIGRDLYDYKDNYSQFERDFGCSAKIISRTLGNNPFMNKHVDLWDEIDVPKRALVLKEAYIAAVKEVLNSQEYVETT